MNTQNTQNTQNPAVQTRPTLDLDELGIIIQCLRDSTHPLAGTLATRLYMTQQQAMIRASARALVVPARAELAPAEQAPDYTAYASTRLMLEGIDIAQHKIIYELLVAAYNAPETEANAPYSKALELLGAELSSKVITLRDMKARIRLLLGDSQDTPAPDTVWGALWQS